MNQRILLQVRQHPIALSIFTLYCLLWAWIGLYIPYHEYTNFGDGESTGLSIFGGILVLFVPYLLILLPFATFSKQTAFYKKLCWLTPLPMVTGILCAIIVVIIFS